MTGLKKQQKNKTVIPLLLYFAPRQTRKTQRKSNYASSSIANCFHCRLPVSSAMMFKPDSSIWGDPASANVFAGCSVEECRWAMIGFGKSYLTPPPPRPIFDLSGPDRQRAEEDNARQSCHPEVTQQAVKQGSDIKYCFFCLLFTYIYIYIVIYFGKTGWILLRWKENALQHL